MALGMIASVAGQAIGGAMGLGIDRIKQGMEVRQAKKLQNLQIQGQKEMGEFNQGLALDTWNKTNYEAQRKHMENAGLNVGLMYGQGGGGGATTSTPTGNVQGQNAGDSNAAGMGMAIGQQLAMQAAQIDLLKAQTNKTNIEADKTAGVDTEGVKLDNEFKTIQNKIQNATTYDQILKVSEEANQAVQQTDKGAMENTILHKTQQAQIDTIQKEAILKGVEIKQREAGINLTEMETKETAEKINKIVAEISRMEAQTEQGKEALLLERMQKEFNTSTPAQIKQWTDIGTDILKAIKITPNKTVNYNTTVK